MKRFLIVLLLAMCSCDQEYNGRYTLYNCKLKNGEPCGQDEGFLELNWDKSFKLSYGQSNFEGRWDFSDDGELALLELSGNKITEQCGVGILDDKRKVISMFNPGNVFSNDSIETMEFAFERSR